MQRREFLRRAGLAAGVAGMPGVLGLGQPPEHGRAASTRPGSGPPGSDPGTRRGDMLYRPLGRTGEVVSAIGLGGYHIGQPREVEESVRLIRAAVDRGITFLDNCWDYHDGGSEERMGRALRDGYRERVFLMSKIDGRTRSAAERQLEESLRRLQTDCIDLMQHHEVIRFEDPDRIFGEDGAQAALLAAKKAGKIRYIGFTGHKDPAIHLRMIEVARQHDYVFDAVQLPLNVLDAHFRSFEREVLPVLVRDGVGVLGMKPLASAAIVESRAATAIEALHYALNLPTATVITGIETQERLDQAIEAVRTFQPLSAAAVSALLAKTTEPARTGRYERFKTGAQFDGTARHPEWLG